MKKLSREERIQKKLEIIEGYGLRSFLRGSYSTCSRRVLRKMAKALREEGVYSQNSGVVDIFNSMKSFAEKRFPRRTKRLRKLRSLEESLDSMEGKHRKRITFAVTFAVDFESNQNAETLKNITKTIKESIQELEGGSYEEGVGLCRYKTLKSKLME